MICQKSVIFESSIGHKNFPILSFTSLVPIIKQKTRMENLANPNPILTRTM